MVWRDSRPLWSPFSVYRVLRCPSPVPVVPLQGDDKCSSGTRWIAPQFLETGSPWPSDLLFLQRVCNVQLLILWKGQICLRLCATWISSHALCFQQKHARAYTSTEFEKLERLALWHWTPSLYYWIGTKGKQETAAGQLATHGSKGPKTCRKRFSTRPRCQIDFDSDQISVNWCLTVLHQCLVWDTCESM